MASMNSSTPLSTLEPLVAESHIVQYTSVATLTILLYDYLLTFDDERRLVWPSRLTFMKVVFLLNRYVPFAGSFGMMYVLTLVNPVTQSDFCKHGFLVFACFIFITYIISEFILYMRAYAVWGRNRIVLVSLIVVLAAVLGSAAYTTSHALVSANVVQLRLVSSGCILPINDADWTAFIALIVSETFAVAVMVAKSWQLEHSKMMRKILSDGIMYYVFILLSSLSNLIILRTTAPAIRNCFLGTQAVLHSIFCNRLLLNIRGAYERLVADSDDEDEGDDVIPLRYTLKPAELVQSTPSIESSLNLHDGPTP